MRNHGDTRNHDDTRNHNDTASLPSPSRPNASRRWTFQRFQRRFHRFHPPSHPNASRRWTFLTFQHVCHYHHLLRVQTQAGSGLSDGFNATATTSTSLTSKRGGGPSWRFNTFATTTTTSLASKREPEVDFSVISTLLPPLSPPSRSNASRRWILAH